MGLGAVLGGRRIGTPLPSAVTTSNGPSSSGGGTSSDARKAGAYAATARFSPSNARVPNRRPRSISREQPASANDSFRQSRWLQSSST